MLFYENDNVRIKEIRELLPSVALMAQFPATPTAISTVASTRKNIHQILQKDSDRLLLIIGPCSVHDPIAAVEYARKLLPLRQRYSQDLEIVMRVYFEKPRTIVGWKGLINDPYRDNSYQINAGLQIARKLLLEINDMQMPAAGEFLDMITPQYLGDLMGWGAIGARTTESQLHRELASGMSCPIGFKNATDGSVRVAVDAIRAAAYEHCFLSVTKRGHSAIVTTRGNSDCHLILRGGKQPNYAAEYVQQTKQELLAVNLPTNIMIDFSHGNSLKQHKRQLLVCEDVCRQISTGETAIIGAMVESNLQEGNQDINAKPLVYGKSITDACIGWDDTEQLIAQLAEAVQRRRQLLASAN